MGVTLDWQPKQGEWERLTAGLQRSTLEQCWSYGTAAAHGHAVERALIRREREAIGLVQVLCRPLLGLVQICEILRGPLFLPTATQSERREAGLALRRAFRIRDRQLLLWMPELTDTPDSHRAMRALGARQMITGYSSIWLDLRRPIEEVEAGLDQKWRNALRGAERSKLKVQVTRAGRALDWLLERHDAFRRQRGFRAPTPALIRGFTEAAARKSDVTIVTAALGSDRVAGALFLTHGNSATYYVGWSGKEGRKTDAQTLVLWRGIETLKKDGVEALDLGGIDTGRAPGVARFKLGLGGEAFTLSGTWL